MGHTIGLLKYEGPVDSSVILRCSMGSLAEITALGGAEVTAGSNEYSTQYGVRPRLTNGGIKFVSVAGYASLDAAGQLSYEIETPAVCINNAVAPSVGNDWGGNTPILTLREAAGGTTPANYMRHYQDASERPQVVSNAGGVLGTSTSPGSIPLEITSAGKGAYTRFAWSWVGNEYDFYIDGIWQFRGLRAGRWTGNVAERIDFMSGANTTVGAPAGFYGRNLLVSTKNAIFPVDRRLAKVGVFGHSFGDRWKMTYSDYYRDGYGAGAFRAAMMRYGLGCYIPADNSSIISLAGAEIRAAAATTMNSVLAQIVAQNCTVVHVYVGTNDCLQATFGTNLAQIITDLKTYLTAILNCDQTRLVVLHKVISTSGNAAVARDENVQILNAQYDLLPAWANATFATKQNALRVADDFTEFGGLTPTPKMIQGLLRGTFADSHPSTFGIVGPMAEIAARETVRGLAAFG